MLEYDGGPDGLFATHKARLTSDLLDFPWSRPGFGVAARIQITLKEARDDQYAH